MRLQQFGSEIDCQTAIRQQSIRPSCDPLAQFTAAVDVARRVVKQCKLNEGILQVCPEGSMRYDDKMRTLLGAPIQRGQKCFATTDRFLDTADPRRRIQQRFAELVPLADPFCRDGRRHEYDDPCSLWRRQNLTGGHGHRNISFSHADLVCQDHAFLRTQTAQDILGSATLTRPILFESGLGRGHKAVSQEARHCRVSFMARLA